ncbi:hypothetical protein ARMGADRAFT_1030004 [Armillaria gallica]|uniref:Uncharacterized protein n=1 Tax=Armillaria gallica TaxID=47427 RepID=A0A2H3DGU5_ARMGA|nr:hypothetical protein ARMGADRAFT_1030004 [Armillaria gallica]
MATSRKQSIQKPHSAPPPATLPVSEWPSTSQVAPPSGLQTTFCIHGYNHHWPTPAAPKTFQVPLQSLAPAPPSTPRLSPTLQSLEIHRPVESALVLGPWHAHFEDNQESSSEDLPLPSPSLPSSEHKHDPPETPL